MPSTPEERVATPLKWDPPNPSPTDLAQFEKVLEVAVQSKLVTAQGASKMLNIIKINPHRRLSRLGQRMSILEEVIKDMQSTEERLDTFAGILREEHSFLSDVVNANPHWKDQEQDAPDDKGLDERDQRSEDAGRPDDANTPREVPELPAPDDLLASGDFEA
jgi:hypothetical protein